MNLLELTPVTIAEAEDHGERIVVVRRRPQSRGLRAPLDWLSYLLAPRRLKLDAIGTFCWRQMDGRRTAGEIADALRSSFGDAAEPAEERLGKFVHSLQREELVRFVELDSRD